jgi:hypothetical protein
VPEDVIPGFTKHGYALITLRKSVAVTETLVRVTYLPGGVL